jgi:hypothetical protein
MVDAIGTPWCRCGGLESSDGRVWCRCGRVGDGSRVREGRVQWRPLGLQVPQVARTPSWYGMVQVWGAWRWYVVRVREQVRCSQVRREDLK